MSVSICPILLSSPYPLPLHFLWDTDNNEIIRLYFFFIAGVCVGFPVLLWALTILYRHHKSGGRISFIAIFLLLSDLLELILSPVILTYTFIEDYIEDYLACIILIRLLFGFRLCGHLLHQLVALESILTQKYPSLAVIFSAPCSIILCSFVWLIAIGIQFIPSLIIYELNMCLCEFPVIECAVTCIVTCKASPDTSQLTDRKPGVLVLSVAVFTLFILYVPFFLTHFFHRPFMLNSLVSMRLISEPLLCVLICKEDRLV